jgi:FtsZ-binding cell division protein ZapB
LCSCREIFRLKQKEEIARMEVAHRERKLAEASDSITRLQGEVEKLKGTYTYMCVCVRHVRIHARMDLTR